MIEVSEDEFKQLVTEAIDSLAKQFEQVRNVAIIVEDEPTPEQRAQLHLVNGQLLYGLYEGVPLTRRQGMSKMLPDKITLFKKPLEHNVMNKAALGEAIRHTLWHEVAHYYGLDHPKIHELE